MTVIKYCLLDISKVIYIMYLKFLVRLDDLYGFCMLFAFRLLFVCKKNKVIINNLPYHNCVLEGGIDRQYFK
jgi:hypothetical protein